MLDGAVILSSPIQDQGGCLKRRIDIYVSG